MYETQLTVLDCWLIGKFAVCTFATLDAYNMLTYSSTEANYLQKMTTWDYNLLNACIQSQFGPKRQSGIKIFYLMWQLLGRMLLIF